MIKKTFKRFSEAVRGAGFNLVTKPLKKIWIDKQKSKFQYKCNFDVEVALDIARQISKVDVVIIGSGDSDFLEIKRYALENKKRFITLCFEKGVSWEMRKGHHVFLEELREQIKRE